MSSLRASHTMVSGNLSKELSKVMDTVESSFKENYH